MKKSTSPTNFGHKDTQPWYKNYMVIIFVIGLPLFVVVACIWFVFYSVQIKDTVVRDDWYMDGKTLYEENLTGPIGIVVGSEGEGVSKLTRDNCDYIISVPMYGQVTSLNASVAASLMVYEVVRQRNFNGK